jgi:DNA sulfur modification protein DndC
MTARPTNARGLNPHHDIPDAFVMAPIAKWSTDEVWEYLFAHNPPPWGYPHDEMLELYRQAGGGECPVVVDLTTPSCGGSRFGCWTCTVVKLDKSMEGFVQSGAAWLQPLNDYRNWLKAIREDPRLRQSTRRSGEVGVGPFTPSAREMILRRLLETEQAVGTRLIDDDDIRYIQTVWSKEFDLSGSRAIGLAREFDREIEEDGVVTTVEANRDLLEDVAARFEVAPDVLTRLLQLEAEFRNLHAWGARPAFRSRIAEIVDRAVKQAEVAVQL